MKKSLAKMEKSKLLSKKKLRSTLKFDENSWDMLLAVFALYLKMTIFLQICENVYKYNGIVYNREINIQWFTERVEGEWGC